MEVTKEKREGIIGFARHLLKKLNDDHAIPYAYQLTYSLLLAIFPFLIFLITLVGFMNLDPQVIIEEIQSFMPGEAYTMFEGIIHEVAGRQNGALLSVSILIAIWSASGGFKAFIKAMNQVHGLEEDRSFIRVNLDALLMVILLAAGIAVSLLLLIFAQPIIDLIMSFVPDFGGAIQDLFGITSYLIPLVFIFFLFIAFYMFVPSRNVKFKYALPGAVFSAVAFMVASLGFQFYVNTFANYSRFYGAMGAVVILMFWLLLISIIMVVGGAVNSILILRKGVRDPYWRARKDSKNEIQPEAVEKIRNKYRFSEPDVNERV